MPELPEVATVVADLREVLIGRRVGRVFIGHPAVVRHPTAETFPAALQGDRFRHVRRLGKYIVCELESGQDLVVHLGMTGHLCVRPGDAPVVRHTHMRLELDDGRELRFDDARRFGRLMVGPHETLRAARVMPPLGVDPLSDDFTIDRLEDLLRRTRRPVKSALLDQAGVSGLGNIYVDEACHQAGVRPGRRASTLTARQRRALHAAIPDVLRRAIANRGTTFDDYRDLWGVSGSHQSALAVYGRQGLPCRQCAHVLRRTTVAGRTTVHCPRCQQ